MGGNLGGSANMLKSGHPLPRVWYVLRAQEVLGRVRLGRNLGKMVDLHRSNEGTMELQIGP
jgi:hypothetical protein